MCRARAASARRVSASLTATRDSSPTRSWMRVEPVAAGPSTARNALVMAALIFCGIPPGDGAGALDDAQQCGADAAGGSRVGGRSRGGGAGMTRRRASSDVSDPSGKRGRRATSATISTGDVERRARGSPPEDEMQRARQVSWLAGQRLDPPGLPGGTSTSGARCADGSPLTVAESAPALPRRRRTGFPLSPDQSIGDREHYI